MFQIECFVFWFVISIFRKFTSIVFSANQYHDKLNKRTVFSLHSPLFLMLWL